MAHFYTGVSYEKNSTDIQRVGAVLRHDIPNKRLLISCIAEQLSCLVELGYVILPEEISNKWSAEVATVLEWVTITTHLLYLPVKSRKIAMIFS